MKIDEHETIKRKEDIEDILEENVQYKPGKAERRARRLVWDRYNDMRSAPLRKEAEAEWEYADKAFRLWTPVKDPDDWRANIMLPDAFAAIQADMQEKINRKSRPLLRGVEDSDEARSELANALMNFNMDTTGYDFQNFLARYSASIRGTAFLFNYYRIDKREIDDPTGVNSDGTLKYEKKEVTDFDDDYTEHIANEFILVDEDADHIDKAKDAIRLEIMNIEEFQRAYALKAGFMNVDKVRSGGDINGKTNFFAMPDEMAEDDVLIIHYYNRALDYYYVLANAVVVHMGPLPSKHKELPIIPVHHYYVPGRFYGFGIPKIIRYLTEERKSIRNLNLDRQKMHLNKMFLVDDRIDIDEDEAVVRPHGMIEVNTGGIPVQQAIVPLEYGDVPASYFRTEEILLEDIRRAHGIDDRIQGVNVGGTATEAAILKESALKRVNMIAQLAEMDSIVRLGRIKWSNIQFFYPAGKVEKIIEENETREKNVARKITVNGKEFKIGEDNQLIMSEIDGMSVLKLDKKMAKFVEGQFDVYVDAEAHQVLSKPIMQAKVTEMLNLIVANPLLVNELDPAKVVKEYLKVNDLTPKNWMKAGGKTTEDQQLMAEMENEIMLQGQMLASTPDASIEHTQVHLQLTETVRYQQASEPVKQIIDQHIMGEHDANPLTGSVADAMGQAGGASGIPTDGGFPGGGLQVQPADIQPSSVTGGEEGSVNAQGGNAPIALQ